MTRLPPLVGRLSRNERALREAEQRQATWAHERKRKVEHELRAQRQAEITAECSKPLSIDNVPLTEVERARIRHWIPYARGKL